MKKVFLFIGAVLLLLIGTSTAYLYLTPGGKTIRKTAGMVGQAASAAMTFRPDGRWWNCSGMLLQGSEPCSADTVGKLQLLPEEQAMLAKFDALPATGVTEEQLAALVGKEPARVTRLAGLSRMEWNNPISGHGAAGMLTISLMDGAVNEYRWFDLKRFYLWKKAKA
ncbi:MAG TPA: hypothetical protein VGN52_20085 [Burkholderiales bacterium]